MSVTVLFARQNSVYKTLPDVDVWDFERNALNWAGGTPVIAHPPCRLWCTCRFLSNAPENEKELAIWAIKIVRKWGGILEHPAKSGLWNATGLPNPGKHDEYGLAIGVDQWWWDHKASKPTWLYICGINTLPSVPFKLGEPTHLISNSRNSNRGGKKLLSRQAREATPREFAKWLVQVASRCHVQ